MIQKIFTSKSERATLYAYHWKTFNFANGKSFKEVHEEHPYCKDPVKSISKIISSLFNQF
jgi:hypothetical protein